MAANVTEIAQGVQSKLGMYPLVTNVSGTDKYTVIFNATYDRMRKRLLSEHPWNFAIRRASLDETDHGPDPVYGFAYSYILPGDVLTLWEIRDERLFRDIDYKLESGFLLMHEPVTDIKYIADEDDPTTFHPLFDEALSYLIAREMAYAMVQSLPVKNMMDQQYRDTVIMAKWANAIQSRPDVLYWNEWEQSRL